MIKISIKKEENEIKEIIIKGHANYDKYGQDIVCASVSSIIITTINAIERIDSKTIEYQEKPYLLIRLIKDNDIINKLIKNMIELLKELEHDYPKNIKFE